jgi:hypothetical protein
LLSELTSIERSLKGRSKVVPLEEQSTCSRMTTPLSRRRERGRRRRSELLTESLEDWHTLNPLLQREVTLPSHSPDLKEMSSLERMLLERRWSIDPQR